MKALVLALLALAFVEWYLRQPSGPPVIGDWPSVCRNGGAA